MVAHKINIDFIYYWIGGQYFHSEILKKKINIYSFIYSFIVLLTFKKNKKNSKGENQTMDQNKNKKDFLNLNSEKNELNDFFFYHLKKTIDDFKFKSISEILEAHYIIVYFIEFCKDQYEEILKGEIIIPAFGYDSVHDCYNARQICQFLEQYTKNLEVDNCYVHITDEQLSNLENIDSSFKNLKKDFPNYCFVREFKSLLHAFLKMHIHEMYISRNELWTFLDQLKNLRRFFFYF